MFRRRHKPVTKYIIVALISLIVVVIGLSFTFLRSITAPAGVSTDTQEFTIQTGQSAVAIASRLEQAGLIRSSYGFRFALKKLHLENRLQAGVYSLTPEMDAYEIATRLTRGIKDVKVTIPEGYRVEQIAEVMEKELGIPYREFVNVGKSYEGYLFPDTYFFQISASAADVVTKMRETFTQKVGEVDQKTLIIASLVERETKGDAEKPVVAGILEKRLSAGWPLELDATIQYILGKSGNWWPSTTLANRQVKSPFNTYLNNGLPPTPIGNPGDKSIKAALYPTPSDYWFYLHGRDGVIHYAATNSEHSANIQKYIYN